MLESEALANIFRRATAVKVLDGWYGPHVRPGSDDENHFTILPKGAKSQVYDQAEASIYADMLVESGLL